MLKDCFRYMQDDNRNILHTGRLLESIGNRYVPFLHVLHLCCGYSLFAATIRVLENFLLLGSMMRQWPIFSLFSLFIWCFVVVLIVMCIEYQCLGHFFAKINLTSWFLATEVCRHQVDVHFGDTKEEA